MSTPVLGKLITTNPDRDCVHFAIMPVSAAVEGMKPGQRVAILPGMDMCCPERDDNPDLKAVGIIDPWLRKSELRMFDKFWVILDPGTIKTLRHVWRHPAVDTPAIVIGDFADRIGSDFATVVDFLEKLRDNPGDDWAKILEVKDSHVPPVSDDEWNAFREAVESYVGIKLDGKTADRYFVCGC